MSGRSVSDGVLNDRPVARCSYKRVICDIRLTKNPREFAAASRDFDIAEMHLTQTSRAVGPSSGSVAILSDMALVCGRRGSSSVHCAQFRNDALAFTLPLRASEGCRLDDEEVDEGPMFLHRSDTIVASGGPREMLAGALPRERVTRAIAALQGVDPHDCVVPEGQLKSLRSRLRGSRHACCLSPVS